MSRPALPAGYAIWQRPDGSHYVERVAARQMIALVRLYWDRSSDELVVRVDEDGEIVWPNEEVYKPSALLLVAALGGMDALRRRAS